MPSTSSGSSVGELRLQRDRRAGSRPAVGHPLGEGAATLLVRPVLQQPGEEQVPRLEQGQVLLVLDLGRGQQPGRLEVEQGGRDDQELAGLVEVPLGRPWPRM